MGIYRDAAAEASSRTVDVMSGILMTPFAWPAMELLAGQAQDGIEATLQLSQGLAQALNGISQCYSGMDDGIASALDKIAAEVEE